MADLIPQRTSVLTQTIEILRNRIGSGEWGAYLPSEIELAQRLEIGRNTVRKALVQLTADGLIEPGRSGKRRRILNQSAVAPSASTSAIDQPVMFLSPFPPDRLPAFPLKQVDEMRPLLNQNGYRLSLITSKAFRLKKPDTVLIKLVEEHPAAAWVLHQTTEHMQKVFQELRVPCVIFGMPHRNIHLPAFTPDLEATSRHAASTLIAKGHQRICFLRAEQGLAGSAEAVKGFRSAFDRFAADDAYQAMIEAVEPEAESVTRGIKRLFRLAHPPTAILIEQIVIVPTVIAVLAQVDRKVPHDVSLISLFYDTNIDFLVPAIAHYRINTLLEVKKLTKAVIHSIQHGPQHAEVVKMMPDFVPGKSIAKL